MKRIWIGIGLLAALLAVGLWLGEFMEDAHQPGARDLNRAAQAAQEGNWDTAKALAARAGEIWQKKWRVTAAVADHEPMDEMDGLFAEVKVYGRQEDTTQFSAACAHLASLLNAMGESHGCYWWNVM